MGFRERKPGETERAVLVVVDKEGKDRWPAGEREQELRSLAESCGVDVVESRICRRKTFTADLLIGKGKADEIAEIAEDEEAHVVIFSEDLSPSQQKNLEGKFKARVVDRTQLILDIFARRATSNEGKVQVELAQLQYLLPRLSRMWLHLGKQAGGIGTKGPGEQQLEVDRRRVRERIDKLKRSLKEITKQRSSRRTKRDRYSMLTVALVGYTNSGKSTLFNALTRAHIKARDQLFSTLDPTVRKLPLPNNQTVLLSDTVGFVHDLPHHLVESFKATLEEVINADMLFLVLDISDENAERQQSAVKQVLKELGAHEKPIFVILNKVDKLDNKEQIARVKNKFNSKAVISALEEDGLGDILDLLIHQMQKDMDDIELELPHKHLSIAKLIREKGAVKKEKYTENGLYISARVPKKVKNQIFKTLQIRSK